MNNACPKCGEKIKATYLKPTCPKCNVNMLYYKLDEQLEADAKKAQDEVDTVNRFVQMLKDSTIKTPWHIIRLILFFTPLASMCLPMFWAGHKNVSLITFVMSIINHSFDLGAIMSDKSYFFAVLSMVLVIILSIIEIITSLFSSTKKGEKFFIAAKVINDLGLFGTAIACACFDGAIRVGFFVTVIIYGIREVLALVINKRPMIANIAAALILVLVNVPFLVFCSSVPQSTICPAIEECDASVVSFNVASAFGTSLEDTDSMDRCDRFKDYMLAYSPDFIGTQEMNSFWFEKLEKSLDGYTAYGVKRGGDSEEKNSEMNAIFFKNSYEVLEQNTIWLSETPNVESKYTYIDSEGKEAEAGCNRICTYVALTDNENIILFLNTHLDNSSEEARIFGANVILNQIAELKAQYGENAKVILTGDFNEYNTDEACTLLSSKLNDTTDLEKEQATYQEWGYRQTGDKPIDFIYTTGNAQNYWVLNRLDDGYVSDHYGIYSEINF